MPAGPLLSSLLQTHFCAGASFEWDELLAFLRDPKFPGREAALRRELEEALGQHLLSPAEFEELTSVDQDSQAEVDAFLRTELWEPLFGARRP